MASAALAGCSLGDPETILLQCVDTPSGLILEIKIKGEQIWFRYPGDKWEQGQNAKFSASVITFRDYVYADDPSKKESEKAIYNEYILNRLTGSASTGFHNYQGPDALMYLTAGLDAKCSTIKGNKLKF